MRQAGTVPNLNDARKFVAHLFTLGMSAHCEQEGSGWVIWVRDEDHLAAAKIELATFLNDPQHERYSQAESKAAAMQAERIKQVARQQGNVIEVRRRWSASLTSTGPLTKAMIWLCVGVFLASGMGARTDGVVMRTLMFVDPVRFFLSLQSEQAGSPKPDTAGVLQVDRITMDPWGEIKRGEIWRLVTPAFIHLSGMHILFNMMMFYQMAGAIENRLGTQKLAVLCLIIAIFSNIAQAVAPISLGGMPVFGGMSGVLYGLFGFIWMKSLYDPMSGFYISGNSVFIMLLWLVLGLLNGLSFVGVSMANWAHGVGLVSGMLLAYVPIVFQRR